MEPKIDDPLDPMPPEPVEPPEERFDLAKSDLIALLAMAFEQGHRTGKANLKLPPGGNPRHELTMMAASYAVAIVREKPWEQAAVDSAVEDHVSRIIQRPR